MNYDKLRLVIVLICFLEVYHATIVLSDCRSWRCVVQTLQDQRIQGKASYRLLSFLEFGDFNSHALTQWHQSLLPLQRILSPAQEELMLHRPKFHLTKTLDRFRLQSTGTSGATRYQMQMIMSNKSDPSSSRGTAVGFITQITPGPNLTYANLIRRAFQLSANPTLDLLQDHRPLQQEVQYAIFQQLPPLFAQRKSYRDVLDHKVGPEVENERHELALYRGKLTFEESIFGQTELKALNSSTLDAFVHVQTNCSKVNPVCRLVQVSSLNSEASWPRIQASVYTNRMYPAIKAELGEIDLPLFMMIKQAALLVPIDFRQSSAKVPPSRAHIEGVVHLPLSANASAKQRFGVNISPTKANDELLLRLNLTSSWVQPFSFPFLHVRDMLFQTRLHARSVMNFAGAKFVGKGRAYLQVANGDSWDYGRHEGILHLQLQLDDELPPEQQMANTLIKLDLDRNKELTFEALLHTIAPISREKKLNLHSTLRSNDHLRLPKFFGALRLQEQVTVAYAHTPSKAHENQMNHDFKQGLWMSTSTSYFGLMLPLNCYVSSLNKKIQWQFAFPEPLNFGTGEAIVSMYYSKQKLREGPEVHFRGSFGYQKLHFHARLRIQAFVNVLGIRKTVEINNEAQADADDFIEDTSIRFTVIGLMFYRVKARVQVTIQITPDDLKTNAKAATSGKHVLVDCEIIQDFRGLELELLKQWQQAYPAHDKRTEKYTYYRRRLYLPEMELISNETAEFQIEEAAPTLPPHRNEILTDLVFGRNDVIYTEAPTVTELLQLRLPLSYIKVTPAPVPTPKPRLPKKIEENHLFHNWYKLYKKASGYYDRINGAVEAMDRLGFHMFQVLFFPVYLGELYHKAIERKYFHKGFSTVWKAVKSVFQKKKKVKKQDYGFMTMTFATKMSLKIESIRFHASLSQMDPEKVPVVCRVKLGLMYRSKTFTLRFTHNFLKPFDDEILRQFQKFPELREYFAYVANGQDKLRRVEGILNCRQVKYRGNGKYAHFYNLKNKAELSCYKRERKIRRYGIKKGWTNKEIARVIRHGSDRFPLEK